MNETYTITCETRTFAPSINFSVSGITADKAKRMMNIAKKAFRDITITCDQTGEIVANTYVNVEWFNQSLQYGTAIDMMGDIYTE